MMAPKKKSVAEGVPQEPWCKTGTWGTRQKSARLPSRGKQKAAATKPTSQEQRKVKIRTLKKRRVRHPAKPKNTG
jgi:hypothetical protein